MGKTDSSNINPSDKNTAAAESGKAEEPFRTPEEVAKTETANASAPGPESEHPIKKRLKNIHHTLKPDWPPTKKQLLICAVILVVAAAGIAAYALTRQGIIGSPSIFNRQFTKVPSKLTGVLVDPKFNKLPVTGVMIENSIFARPQSGLSRAGVVYEAIAEAGITRFLALYQADKQPNNLGPVRSVRPYYLEWALGFDASVAHVGGSPEALSDVNSWHVKNLDQFFNSGYYHRISSRDAPHNMYTSISQLYSLEKSKGFKHSRFTSFNRKNDGAAKKPKVTSININFSGPDYDTSYKYRRVTNSYLRFEGGQPHIDANTHKQINPKVVIALVMPYGLEADGYHSDYNTISSGSMFVFQDGRVTKGTWYKKHRSSQFVFKNKQGKPLRLNAGQTWIAAVGSTSQVSYGP